LTITSSRTPAARKQVVKQVVKLGTFGAFPQSSLGQALASIRPAGEVEGVESGKEREEVWNEASLRLKDALGL
jgi:hypothetical protein